MNAAAESRTFGSYRTNGLLGCGAMASVYLAENVETREQVALKVMEIDGALSESRRDELVRRFQAEARIASRLDHPNLVRVHETGRDGDFLYLAMEVVPGDTLDDVLRTGRILELQEIVEVAAAVAATLDHAHARGVVHRDVKPGNVLLSESGATKVVDFGIAHEATSTLTGTGIRIGTPAYMSPEQVRGAQVTGAADQFGLAVLLYRMLTGRLPFQGDRPTDMMYAIVNEEPPPASSMNVRLDRRVDAVLQRALAKEPEARFADCSSLVDAIRQALGMAPATDTAANPDAAGLSMTMTVTPASAEAIRREIAAGARGAPPVVDETPLWKRKAVVAAIVAAGLLLLLWAALI